MEQFLQFTVVGLVTAAIYAVLASGLVVTYTTSGIFNFAHGATAMMAAFTYWQLSVKWDVPVLASVALILFVLAPAFGLFLDVVIMRGLEGTSEVIKTVVTVGVLFGLIALAQIIWGPNVNRIVEPFFGRRARSRSSVVRSLSPVGRHRAGDTCRARSAFVAVQHARAWPCAVVSNRAGAIERRPAESLVGYELGPGFVTCR